MDITLKGTNGEKVIIPIEDLIQKYWSDENSKPNRIEMSAKVKDETVLAAACAALAQEAIPYSLDCQRHILVDENHYFEAIDVFDDYDIDFDVIRNF